MGFTVHPLHTLFEFIPEDEQKKLEKDSNYKPFKCLFIQMDGELVKSYRSKMSKFTKQKQEMSQDESGGSKFVIINETDTNSIINLNRETAKSIVTKVSGFDIPELKVEYPVYKDNALVEEWCSTKEHINMILDRIPASWIGELIQTVQDISALTPFEKKS